MMRFSRRLMMCRIMKSLWRRRMKRVHSYKNSMNSSTRLI